MIANVRIIMLTLCVWLYIPGAALAEEAAGSCDHQVAQWLDPASGEVLATEALFTRLANSRIVLLGEVHDRAAHHRWQAYVMAALHSRNANLVVGFEMLPRRAQPVLDDWSSGRLDEETFLEQSDWKSVWGYDAALYLPLLHFARLNRLPAVALNVDRELISRIGREGWHSLNEDDRMGLSDPAPASDAYRDSLAQLYAYKQSRRDESETAPGEDVEPDLEAILGSDAFSNFVDAQLTWDRAMAEALAAAHRRDPGALVVGIVGRGHAEYGYGIPHQLAAMGIEGVDILLPLETTDICDPLEPDLATAVFMVDADGDDSAPPRPLLGVMIETSDLGVRVIEVVADSVAAHSGIVEGDVIQAAAGFETLSASALIEVIQRQAPGTWLPLKILRGDEALELIARFPQAFE